MTITDFRRGVEQAASTHQGGMKLRPCLRLDPAWFASIVDEVRDLVARRPPSEVGDKSHPTYWTGPYGRATQHSLFNASGVTSDTSVDHNHRHEGKTFNAPECPALHRFARAFESRLLNFRLNGLMHGAGLSPHEEFVVHGDNLRLRFHLPILTSEKATLVLDDERFHLQPGVMYYFNNGCVHGAENLGADPRFHLVFDMFLDEWLWTHVLDDASPETPDPGARKLTPAEALELGRGEPYPIDEYVIGTPTGVVLRATRQVSPTGETHWVKTPITL
jgi:hypothetical protein